MDKKLIFILLLIIILVIGFYFFKTKKSPIASTNSEILNVDNIKNINNTNDPEQDLLIDLASQDLKEFPREVLTMGNVQKLVLSNNEIKSLPSEIGQLDKLVEFYINKNQLTGALPGEIRQMTDLVVLVARDNNMTGIPAEIGQLKKLELLDLENNQIDTMPDEIENLKDSLKILNLRGNKYSQQQIDDIQKKLPDTQIVF